MVKNNNNKNTREQELLDEYNLLNALKRVYATHDGKRVLDHILSNECSLSSEAWTNNGETGHTLGKQKVGRSILNKMIAADIKVDASIFSYEQGGKIERLRQEIES